MAVVLQERFREHIGVVEALKASYCSRDDVERVLTVQQLEDELQQLCRTREDTVQDIVRELCSQKDAVEAVLESAEPPSVHEERVCDLQTAIQAAQRDDQQSLLQSHAQDVQRRSERVEELVTETEPRTRHELSLYVHITNINWKLQNADGRIAGTICSPEHRDIRSIDLDPAEKSQFEIVNSIWDSIG